MGDSAGESETATGATAEWLSLVDFAEPAKNAESVWLRAFAFVAGGIALVHVLRAQLTPLVSARPLPNLSSEEHVGYRVGLTEPVRREIFEALAVSEKAERKRASDHNTWNGHLWSREDDRGYVELTTVRGLAAKYHCSLSAVYAVLEEGIRAGWPGPDGEPLPPTTPPQDPRTTW